MPWLRELAELFHLRSVEPRHRLQALRFRNLARNVRRLCELNDEARDKLVGGWVLDRRYLASFVERSMDLAEEVYFDSSVLAPGHRPRYSALDELRVHLSTLLAGRSGAVEAALVVPLEDADLVEEDLVGPGPRLVAEAARRLGAPLAPGFVITTAAFAQALEHDAFRSAAPAPREPDAKGGPEAPWLPDPLREAIGEALGAAGSPEVSVAFLVFSEGSGSPTTVEGGLPATVEAVAEAYRRLLSRVPAPRQGAATPRLETGSPGKGAASCVLVGPPIERGTLYTCDPERPLTLRLVVSSNEGPRTHLFDRYPIGERGPTHVPDGYRPLVRMALALERLAGRPQTVAWVRDPTGFRPLDSGPVVFSNAVESPGPRVAEALRRHELLARPARPPSVAGVAAGPLKHVRRAEDLVGAGDHSVLVLHPGAPSEIDAAVAQGAAALLVRDASAAEPWMELAWEARLPLLAGLDQALDAVPDGELVTVDADERAVYRGLVHELLLYELLEAGGGGDDAELRLLVSLMQSLGRARRQEQPGRGNGGPATLFELVQEAHSAAVRAFDSVAEGGWGTRTGAPLLGTGWPGMLRVVDVGGGTDRTGRGVWPGGLDAQRLRCLPLRVFLEPFGHRRKARGRPTHEPPSGLAMVGEDSLTLHIRWAESLMVMDARLSEYPGSNSIYCAFGPGGRVVSAEALSPLGFHRVELGPDQATWLLGREYEETRRGLNGLARELARLLPSSETDSRPAAESEVPSEPTDATEQRR